MNVQGWVSSETIELPKLAMAFSQQAKSCFLRRSEPQKSDFSFFSCAAYRVFSRHANKKIESSIIDMIEPRWTRSIMNAPELPRSPVTTLLQRRRFLVLTLLLVSALLLSWHYRTTGLHVSKFSRQHHFESPKLQNRFDGDWKYSRDADNLQLTSAQCDQAFPGLFLEVDRAVDTWKHSRINEATLDTITARNGFVRAMVYEGGLYVISKEGSIYSRELATLHAIHRSIISSPERIPDIEFCFNVDDKIDDKVPLWAFARRESDTHLWLIPDFGYWSWPETRVGSMHEVRLKAMEKDAGYAWQRKIGKLMWRGATMGLSLRERLLAVTDKKPWSDVKELHWHDATSMADDLKSMPEHCEYKYLMQTEGNSYSGRLKYLQNCASVIVSHPLDWIEHHHHLMESEGPQQNFVEVQRSFDDLQEKVTWLQHHDQEASKIAQRSLETFGERYLTPAAETCYWRRLFHGWASVSAKPRFYKEENGTMVWRGLPVESFLLERRMDWEPY